jgi:glutathione peroxidase
MREQSSLNGGDMTWNFAKFLVDGQGKVIKSYMPDDKPIDIVPDFEKLLN